MEVDTLKDRWMKLFDKIPDAGTSATFDLESHVYVEPINLDEIFKSRPNEVFKSIYQIHIPDVRVVFPLSLLVEFDTKKVHLKHTVVSFGKTVDPPKDPLEKQIYDRLHICISGYILPKPIVRVTKNWTMDRSDVTGYESALDICESFVDEDNRMAGEIDNNAIASACARLIRLSRRMDMFPSPVISYINTVVEGSIERGASSSGPANFVY
mgnify:CR=1 FL=1